MKLSLAKDGEHLTSLLLPTTPSPVPSSRSDEDPFPNSQDLSSQACVMMDTSRNPGVLLGKRC